MSSIKVVKGDVRFPQKDNQSLVVIPHVCNNIGVMGAGVALSLRNMWPIIYESYHKYVLGQSRNRYYEEIRQHQIKILGDIGSIDNKLIKVEKDIYVANMIAQDNIRGYSRRPLKYDALVLCMLKVRNEIENIISENSKLTISDIEIHTPKFGADLAGGNWDFIIELIKDIWNFYGLKVVVYEFNK